MCSTIASTQSASGVFPVSNRKSGADGVTMLSVSSKDEYVFLPEEAGASPWNIACTNLQSTCGAG